MPKRVLILSTSVGSGHLAAASALEQAFSHHPDVEVISQDALELTSEAYRIISADAYQFLARGGSWILGLIYDYYDQPFKNEALFQSLFDLLNAQPLVGFIRDFRPDLVVCTHFMPAGIIVHLMEQQQIDCGLAIVATDYDFQGRWLHTRFSRYFVALDETKAQLVALGLPAERITVSGIPVRAAFAEPIDRAAALARFELRPDLPTLLVSAGAVGGGPAREVVAQITRLRHPVQTIVVCGQNLDLRRTIEAMVLPHADRFRVLGYSGEMPGLMQAATLFIGKPGGLSSAECMAAGLPMLIIAPIPGQEERNSSHLLESGAALRCNDLETVAFKIDALLDEPERLAQMRVNTRRLARPDAAQLIAATLLADPSEPYVVDTHRLSQRKSLDRSAHRLRGGVTRSAVVYVEATGVLLGRLSVAEWRAIVGRRRPSPSITLTIGRAEIEHLWRDGAAPAIVAQIEQRLDADGRLTVRINATPDR